MKGIKRLVGLICTFALVCSLALPMSTQMVYAAMTPSEVLSHCKLEKGKWISGEGKDARFEVVVTVDKAGVDAGLQLGEIYAAIGSQLQSADSSKFIQSPYTGENGDTKVVTNPDGSKTYTFNNKLYCMEALRDMSDADDAAAFAAATSLINAAQANGSSVENAAADALTALNAAQSGGNAEAIAAAQTAKDADDAVVAAYDSDK